MGNKKEPSVKIPSVQFFDSLPKIKDMVRRRFPLKEIWLELKNQDKFSGTYQYFCRLIKKEPHLQAEKEVQPKEVQPKEVQPKEVQPKEEVESKKGGSQRRPAMFMDDLSSKKKK